MVKLINCGLLTALAVNASSDPHIRNRCLTFSPLCRLVPWLIRPLARSPSGSFASWLVRPLCLVDSPLACSPSGSFALGSFALWLLAPSTWTIRPRWIPVIWHRGLYVMFVFRPRLFMHDDECLMLCSVRTYKIKSLGL